MSKTSKTDTTLCSSICSLSRRSYEKLLREHYSRRERDSNLWFLRISQNTQIVVYQPFVKFAKNQDITKYLSVSQFLGVKLGVDFEFTPRRMKS